MRRARVASRSAAWSLPFATARSRLPAIRSRPASARARSGSYRATCLPIAAWTWAMPWPMSPAPATKTRSMLIARAPRLASPAGDRRGRHGDEARPGASRSADARPRRPRREEVAAVPGDGRERREHGRREPERDVEEQARVPTTEPRSVGGARADREREQRGNVNATPSGEDRACRASSPGWPPERAPMSTRPTAANDERRWRRARAAPTRSGSFAPNRRTHDDDRRRRRASGRPRAASPSSAAWSGRNARNAGHARRPRTGRGRPGRRPRRMEQPRRRGRGRSPAVGDAAGARLRARASARHGGDRRRAPPRRSRRPRSPPPPSSRLAEERPERRGRGTATSETRLSASPRAVPGREIRRGGEHRDEERRPRPTPSSARTAMNSGEDRRRRGAAEGEHGEQGADDQQRPATEAVREPADDAAAWRATARPQDADRDPEADRVRADRPVGEARRDREDDRRRPMKNTSDAANTAANAPPSRRGGASAAAVTASGLASAPSSRSQQPVRGRVRVELVARDGLVDSRVAPACHAGASAGPGAAPRGSPSTCASARASGPRGVRPRAPPRDAGRAPRAAPGPLAGRARW